MSNDATYINADDTSEVTASAPPANMEGMAQTATAATTEQQVRGDVRHWLQNHWDPTMDPDQWLATVVDSGWAAPSWPTQWFGKGLDPTLTTAVIDEFRSVGAFGAGADKHNLWSNTVLTFGSDELKARHLRALLLGEIQMCLLYSEPGAGSDLAAAQTTGILDGDEFVVTGQKVWTSNGRHADYAFLIARTDWDVPKHRGLSFFFLPMKQTGVEVRPLRQATGDARFNEVFITEARVPAENLLGEMNKGWGVLQTALAYERAWMGEVVAKQRSNASGGDTGKSNNGAASARPKAAFTDGDAPTPDLSLVALAHSVGKSNDPMVRQSLMKLHLLVTVNDWNNRRGKAALTQGTSSPVVSLGKLAMSRILHDAGSLEKELLGAEGMIGGSDSPRSADATYSLLNAFFTSIGGGTDQIQRNIIGERILGLPKEPELDKNVAFREVRKASASSERSSNG